MHVDWSHRSVICLDYAAIIRNQRVKIGLSQERLAQRIGTSLSRIQKWETGETLPNLLQVPLLCAALQISYDEFFSLPGNPHGRQHRRKHPIPMYQISYLPVMCNHTMQYYRLIHGMSIREVSEKCSVSESVVQKWESGRLAPKLDLIPVICNTLNIKIWQFFE